MSDVAVVVGATGAVGSALTTRLAARGMTVVAVARGADALGTLAASTDRTVACVADIADNAAIETIRDAIGGPVRLAVFAAGLPVRGSVETLDPDLMAVGANVKLGGVVRLLHAVRDRLEPGARFVAFAGTLGLEPGPHEAGPGAINAGLVNLMKQISLLYGPRGVTVHTLAPGPMDTDRLRRIAATIAEERGVAVATVWREYEARTSLGRLPTVDEVVWAVETLLAPQADVLHGTVTHLDAGGLRGVG
jgi:NAD(P)-dependent dehydrogenase (short-subunit alcohol dehydrogenase family)